MTQQILVFQIGNNELAFSIDYVQEIVKMTQLTSLPETPAFFVGVFEFRNKVIPVINLSSLLQYKTTKKDNKDTRIIVILLNDSYYGLLVDAVTEVITVNNDQIKDTTIISQINSDIVSGIYKNKEKLTCILEIEHLLKGVYLDEVNSS